MEPLKPTGEPRNSSRPLILGLIGAALILLFLGIILNRHGGKLSSDSTRNPTASTLPLCHGSNAVAHRLSHGHAHHDNSLASQSAEEIVANKLIKFGQRRRELLHAMAKHFHVEVPDDVERFFAAVESGRWEEIDAAHNALLQPGKGLNEPRADDLHKIWRPIQETWGVAREAHNWPAQTLLDYGNSVLGSLRPGMIYVGGTDPGCFIPTMLNETSDGERHIVLTQNALADGDYLNYLQFQYADQMSTLTEEESQRAYQEYAADAQKRLQHDQQFPDEPRQLKPGEDVKIVDDKPAVSGQVAVMGVNEKLFQLLMDKNPNASFAMEESFPFASMSAGATTLGPVMEMRADGQNTLTAERASQSVDYWRDTAQQLLSDTELADDSWPRKAWSKLVSSQAGLLQDHGFSAEAEQDYRTALDLNPSSSEAVFRYVNLLLNQGRTADAVPVAEAASKAAPDNGQFRDLLQRLKRLPGH